MSDRNPAIPFRPGLQPFHAREHQLANFPMLRGTWVNVTFEDSATVGYALHGLGRTYVGATSVMQVSGVVNQTALRGILLSEPDLTSTVVPPDKYVLFSRENSSGTEEEVTIRAWVF